MFDPDEAPNDPRGGRNAARLRYSEPKGDIGEAKIVSRIALLVRKSGLSYENRRYVSKRVREVCELRPARKSKRLPRVPTSEEFRRFYAVVDRAADVQHAWMLRGSERRLRSQLGMSSE